MRATVGPTPLAGEQSAGMRWHNWQKASPSRIREIFPQHASAKRDARKDASGTTRSPEFTRSPMQVIQERNILLASSKIVHTCRSLESYPKRTRQIAIRGSRVQSPTNLYTLNTEFQQIGCRHRLCTPDQHKLRKPKCQTLSAAHGAEAADSSRSWIRPFSLLSTTCNAQSLQKNWKIRMPACSAMLLRR